MALSPGSKPSCASCPNTIGALFVFENSDSAAYLNDVLKFTLLDHVLRIRASERIDCPGFFKDFRAMDDADDAEKPEWMHVDDVESIGIFQERIAATYRNVGYKELVLEIKDGKLVADCSDRCFPYTLHFEHLTAWKFAVEMYGVWEGCLYSTIQGEIRVEDGEVVAVGVELEKDVKGGLIWFDRIE